MNKKDKFISNTRLASQKVSSPDTDSPHHLVGFMGAMQAQDFSMAAWAIGLRLARPSKQKLESSLNRGEIIRIHVLRPTWHFIAAEDVHWMLKLSAPRIRSSMKSRHVNLELPEEVITKTNRILEKALENGKSLTRTELTGIFRTAGIRTDDNRLSHIMLCAELDGLVCSGPADEKKQTYSLLDHRISIKKELTTDEALAELARRYFLSRCPATLQDFSWWANLPGREAKRAFDNIKTDFYTETIGSQEYVVPGSFNAVGTNKSSVYLLPAFDEFLISYKDRSSSLALVDNRRAVSVNGIFYPTVIINGQVAGLWQRRFINNRVIIETNLFNPPGEQVKKSIGKQSLRLARFLEMEPEVRIKTGVQ